MCAHQFGDIDIEQFHEPSTKACVIWENDGSEKKATSIIDIGHGPPVSIVAFAHNLVDFCFGLPASTAICTHHSVVIGRGMPKSYFVCT